ncbi:MAG: response regulator [Candidatus Paceibacterota bacterium]
MSSKDKPQKVLIVDDEDFICNIYSKSFKDEGIETEAVHSGKEMLDILEEKSNEYDVILLDIVMPEMDGFEALEMAHKKEMLGRTLLVVLSNHADQISQEKAKELGAHNFVVKSSLLPEDIVKEVISTFQEKSA